MFLQIQAKLAQNNHEWRSKLTDGLLAGIILVVLWSTIMLTTWAVKIIFGLPGMLVDALALLAVAMFSLQQAIRSRHVETTRAWYGIIGGLLAWFVAWITADLEGAPLPGPAALIIWIMVALIVVLLWRVVLPLGVRYFALTFLLNWTGYIFLSIQQRLTPVMPVILLATRVIGILAAFGVLLVIFWIFFQSRRRLQRISGALAAWFLFSLVIFAFRGAPF